MNTKTRKITLSNHAPVQINEAEWPVIARGSGDSFRGNDYGRRQQALAQGEVDRYFLTVRRHADGRVLVYGVFDAATAWTGNEDRREGELIDAGPVTPSQMPDTLVRSIRRVGDLCGLPDSIIRECIADLPAETI